MICLSSEEWGIVFFGTAMVVVLLGIVGSMYWSTYWLNRCKNCKGINTGCRTKENESYHCSVCGDGLSYQLQDRCFG